MIWYLISIYCLSIVSCGVVINEINADDPAKPERNEFIELIAFGAKRGSDRETTQLDEFSLRGYKIILPTAFHKGVKAPTIELVANLWNSKIQNSFFVLGGIGVIHADLKVDSTFVGFREKFTKSRSLFGFVGNANIYPNALILVYNSDGSPNLKLSEKSPFLKVS